METIRGLSNDSIAEMDGVFDPDILRKILCKLTMQELYTARLVCKAWNCCFVSDSFKKLHDDSSPGFLVVALSSSTVRSRLPELILYDIEKGTQYRSKIFVGTPYCHYAVVTGGAGGLVIFATTRFIDTTPKILSANGYPLKSINIKNIYIQNPIYPNGVHKFQMLTPLVSDVPFLRMPKLLLLDSPYCRQRIVLAGHVIKQENGSHKIMISVYDFFCGRWSEVDTPATGIQVTRFQEASMTEVRSNIHSRGKFQINDATLSCVVVRGATLYIFSSMLYADHILSLNLETRVWDHWKFALPPPLVPKTYLKTKLLNYEDRLFMVIMIPEFLDVVTVHEDASVEAVSVYILEAELKDAVCIWNEISRIPNELLQGLESRPNCISNIHCVDLGPLLYFMVGTISSLRRPTTFSISYQMPEGPWRRMPSLDITTVYEAVDFFNGTVFKPSFTAVPLIRSA